MGTWARGYDDTVGSAKRDGVAVQKWKGGETGVRALESFGYQVSGAGYKS